MIDIKKIEAAALAATQGEWVVSDHIYASDGKRIASYQMISRDDGENEANATHIATANPAAVLELIEKYKALEAENERLKALNVELTAKCNWYNSDGARLERERDELKRRLAELKGGLTYRNSLVYRLDKELAEYKADRDEFQSVITAIGVAATGYDFSGGLAEHVAKAFAERDKYKADAERYLELILAVGRKFPNETRHETALKYIRRMEEPPECSAMKGATE